MSEKRKIQEAIRRIAGTYENDPVNFVICEVESFDIETQTCDCIPVGGDATTKIPGVSLKSEPNNGILIKPKIGSIVTVAMSLKTAAYIFMFSDIDFMEVMIASVAAGGKPTRLKIEEGKITFNDGSFDGIVKVNSLVTKLNAVESDLNILKAVFSAWVVAPGDGGAALKATAAAWIAQMITPTVKVNLENPLIIHGL